MDAEKIHGLRLISERFLPQHMDAFDQSIARSLSRTAVVRITLTEPPTGKRKQYDKEGSPWKRNISRISNKEAICLLGCIIKLKDLNDFTSRKTVRHAG